MTFKVLSANPNLFERNNSLQNESCEITQLSKSAIAPLQLAQNAAARLVVLFGLTTTKLNKLYYYYYYLLHVSSHEIDR